METNMSNYKESAVTGTQWTRSHIVVVNNDWEQPPHITFGEETRIAIAGGGSIQASTGGLSSEFVTGTEFPLLNPLDNTVIGTASHDQMYVMLYSLYMHLAAARDASQ